MKFRKNAQATFPQQGERTVTGEKLPKSNRHKNLKSMYALIGDRTKPWRSKLKRVN